MTETLGTAGLRIGMVCPYDWGVPGGVRSHIHDLALELMRMGHEVDVLAPADEDVVQDDWVTWGGRPVPVPFNGSVARLTFGPGAARRVRRWLREGEFDVLHVHQPISPSLPLIACWAARGPIVATFHADIPRSRVLLASAAALQTAMEKITARIAVSEHARRTIMEHLGGDAVLIPNGVDVSAFAGPRAEPSRPTVLFLGRLDEPRKGLGVLLAAVPELIGTVPGIRIVVAGPGQAQSEIAALPPEAARHVEFVGALAEAEKINAFREADIYVAPHTGQESFGIVLLEAMAAGTPVVASDIDAFRWVLDGAGVFFPAGDADALSTVIEDLFAHPERRADLAAAGRVRAADFDWARVATDIQNVYRSVQVEGTKVTEDLRGQIIGRWGNLGREVIT